MTAGTWRLLQLVSFGQHVSVYLAVTDDPCQSPRRMLQLVSFGQACSKWTVWYPDRAKIGLGLGFHVKDHFKSLPR